MNQFYLSFADEEKFLGSCVVEGDIETEEEAVRLACALGINPGGEVLIIAIPEEDEWFAKEKTNRLFRTIEEAEAAFGPAERIFT